MKARRPHPESGVVTWGWYAVTEGAAPAGGSKPGLIPRDRTAHAFWAAWWTEDPRQRPEAAPDAFGFYYGPKAAFFAGAEAESVIRREKSPRAYVLAIDERFARAAYREGAPRKRSEATDFEEVANAWCDERGIPRTATVDVVKRAWREYVKTTHSGEGAVGVDLGCERRRYEAALAQAQQRATKRQAERVAAGEAPVDNRLAIKTAKRIATEVRERLEVVAKHLRATADMCGLCHFAALGLAAALRAEGLEAMEASSGSHSWADVLLPGESEAMLLDITATQYGLARVYVRLPGQRRSWPYDNRRVRGRKARDGQRQMAAVDIVNAPERWWAEDVAKLPVLLRTSKTRFTKTGARLAREPEAMHAIATGKLDLDALSTPTPGSSDRSPLARAIEAAVRCVKCDARLGGCNCWTKCSCGWSYETEGGACRNPVHAAKKKRRGQPRAEV